MAAQLDGYNSERKAIELQVLDQAICQVEESGTAAGLVMAASEGWHAGVIGIVASRLKERFGKPALVVALEKGVGKGSARIRRSEEHTSELQSLMRSSYAVFCLKKKKKKQTHQRMNTR